MRFAVDAMLGDVARWLRILGHDATYASPNLEDKRVLELAQADGRVLVTRDHGLAKAGQQAGLRVVSLSKAPVEESLITLFRELGMRPDRALRFSRCTTCNGRLVTALPSEVDVPPRVLELQTSFQKCPDCGKAYWEGTHVRAMATRLDALDVRLMGPEGA